MKSLLRTSLALVIALHCAATARAQTNFTLNGLSSFGAPVRYDGSIRPGDSIGINPQTGNSVAISAPGGYGIQPGDAQISTNGFNMRGLAYDPITGKLIFVDTHEGTGGTLNAWYTNAAIYVLDPDSGQIIGALSTNGIGGGNYTHVVAGVAEDGVVYVCNQVLVSTNNPFKIYRWGCATNYTDPPVLAFNSVIYPSERLGQTMAVRGAGTNTQIIVGTANTGERKTNVVFFTTADGTNFTAHQLSFPGITNGVFHDGIAFGPGNTLYAKQVGQPLVYLSFDPVGFTGGFIASWKASSLAGTDPMLNLAAIAVDNTNHLLAGVEEIGGVATAGRGKVWLFDLYDPTNRAPAILTSRTYVPNFQKTTAPMGYVCFAPGTNRLYANVVNNGFLASTVDPVSPMVAPMFELPADFPDVAGNLPKVTDLPAYNRVAAGQTAHFEVFAIPDVTNYQWFSNDVVIAGATTSFLDIPNAQTNLPSSVFYVIASNAAGSTESAHCTLMVIDTSGFSHPAPLWSFAAGGAATYITSTGGSGTPNERCIAFNGLSNQLLVVKGPSGAIANTKVYVVDADTGAYLYLLNTTGLTASLNLNLCGIGVADDGAVYACSVGGATSGDQSFKVYRWTNSGPNTLPQVIFGTNSSAATGNPIQDLLGHDQTYRFGDSLAVHGAGTSTEIIVDSGSPTLYASILTPTDDTMTNWTQNPYLLQNTVGSYGFQGYGSSIGRSLQFGPSMPGPRGNVPTFWQKRYLAAGTPLAGMGYILGGGVAALDVANFSLPLFTNGPVGINFTLNLAAAVCFSGPPGTPSATPDALAFYDLSDPSQAVLLHQDNLTMPASHAANGNAVAQVIFGVNRLTGTNYIFAIVANNGISAFTLAGGLMPPPRILAQPGNLRLLDGTSGTLSVQVDDPLATIAWWKGTNAPADTAMRGPFYTIIDAQPSDAGDYFVIVTNTSGSVTSRVAHVSIGFPNDNYTLSQAWAAGPGNPSYPYVTSSGFASVPVERTFTYNALSNQLIVVQAAPYPSTIYHVYVVDANTGTVLYYLNTTGVLNEGPSEVSGSSMIDLVGIAVADDGAVYGCNMTPNASGGDFGNTMKMLHVYRWANSGPSTTPTVVYEGDPSGQPAGFPERWGDVMAARGSGTNTVLFLNTYDGQYGAVLKPTSSSMTHFTSYFFNDSGGAGYIGRSIQSGPTNTVFEKRKAGLLVLSAYNTNDQTSAILNVGGFSTTLGGVFVDTAHHLAAGVDFVGSAVSHIPDAVSLYDVSDLSSPMFLAQYNFPSNQVANANFISQTIIAGWKVFALDGNNGMMAFYINPPVNSMILSIARSGTNVDLSWGNSGAVLQGTTNLSPPAWTDLMTPGQTNSVQPAAGETQFYRLVQRR